MYLPGKMIQFDSYFSNGLLETTNQFDYLHHGRTDFGSQKFPVIGVGFRRISQGLESSRMFTCHLPRVVAQGPKGKNGKSSGERRDVLQDVVISL